MGGCGLLTGIDKVGYVLLRHYWPILWLSSRLSSVFEGILCVFGGYFDGLSLSFANCEFMGCANFAQFVSLWGVQILRSAQFLRSWNTNGNP